MKYGINKNILFDQRYDELCEIMRSENESGALWPDVETMLEYVDEEYLLEDLGLTEDALDAVALGEATDLDTAMAAEGDI